MLFNPNPIGLFYETSSMIIKYTWGLKIFSNRQESFENVGLHGRVEKNYTMVLQNIK